MITCTRCGKENQDHYKFCLGCGNEIKAAPKAEPKLEPRPVSRDPLPSRNRADDAATGAHFAAAGRVLGDGQYAPADDDRNDRKGQGRNSLERLSQNADGDANTFADDPPCGSLRRGGAWGNCNAASEHVAAGQSRGARHDRSGGSPGTVESAP